MMEGVASEAASLAGHLRLGWLTVFHDDNRISLEGSTRLHFSEDVGTRFAAYGWQVLRLFDVADAAAIDETVSDAAADPDRPTLVIVHTHIGVGSPVVDTAAAHGALLGEAGAASAREALGWTHRPFEIPPAVYDNWRQGVAACARAHTEWCAAMDRYRRAHPHLAAEYQRVQSGRLPDGWQQAVPRFETGTRIATRRASGQALNALAAAVPELVGGAADLAPSTLTYLDGHDDVGRRLAAGGALPGADHDAPGHPAPGRCGRRGPRRRRGDRATGRASVLQLRHRHRRGRRGVAARQRGGLLAAGPHGRCARRRPAPGRVQRPGVRLRRGRWTALAAVEEGVPAHVLTAALFERFSSRGEADFADRVLSAMRKQFGGHAERTAG